ncbi:MAG: hypothetical protein QOC98_2150, partial [Frankiaceae bacterium]|nr:hypothetical protein [Frankiaceae bacterium]
RDGGGSRGSRSDEAKALDRGPSPSTSGGANGAAPVA